MPYPADIAPALPTGWRKCWTGSLQRQAQHWRATVKVDVQAPINQTYTLVMVREFSNLDDALAVANEVIAR